MSRSQGLLVLEGGDVPALVLGARLGAEAIDVLCAMGSASASEKELAVGTG